MKRIIAIMLVFASLFAFAACAGKDEKANNATTAAPTAAQEQAESPQSAETTKISAIAGKRIKLKSVASLNSVTIYTNNDGIASVMMVHKIYDNDEAFQAAIAQGDHGTYKLETVNEESREIIFSDSETVKGMTYDEIMALAEKLDDYIIIPEQ